MRPLALPLLLATAAFCLGGCGGEEAEGEGVTVPMSAQNSSGQSGTAMLTADGDSATKVVIELDSGTADPQPAHIHAGRCADLDPKPKYALDGLVNGESRTTVDAPLSELASGGFAINVHKSDAELHVYVACGDIGGGDEPASTERDYGY